MALVLLVELQRSNGPKGNRPDPQANEQGGGGRGEGGEDSRNLLRTTGMFPRNRYERIGDAARRHSYVSFQTRGMGRASFARGVQPRPPGKATAPLVQR